MNPDICKKCMFYMRLWKWYYSDKYYYFLSCHEDKDRYGFYTNEKNDENNKHIENCFEILKKDNNYNKEFFILKEKCCFNPFIFENNEFLNELKNITINNKCHFYVEQFIYQNQKGKEKHD